MLSSPQGIDLYTANAIGVTAIHNYSGLWFLSGKSIKKRRVCLRILFSFFGGA
jgi:hypothetical protein